MENGTSGGRGQNGNCNNLAWDMWELGTSRFDWSSSTNSSFHQDDTIATTVTAAAATHPLMLAHQTTSIYAGAGSHFHPDPHLICLNLGKRHYFEDAATAAATHLGDLRHVGTKRGRPPYYGGGAVGPSPTSAAVLRCQVDGCPVALESAKEYHRRHKVCEMHAKAAKAVVHGVEQRYCQQCSRFHAVTEFDDSKRSCRRRLAGHNERRRKGSLDSIARNPFQGRALSLLSSKSNSWLSSADISSRCSAALRELIAENRAAILSQQVVLDGGDWHQHHHTMEEVINGTQPGSDSLVTSSHHHQIFPEPHSWDDFNGGGGGHVTTLDLMQAPSSAFGLLSVREKSREEKDECSESWRSLGGGGGHVV